MDKIEKYMKTGSLSHMHTTYTHAHTHIISKHIGKKRMSGNISKCCCFLFFQWHWKRNIISFFYSMVTIKSGKTIPMNAYD